MSYNLPLLVFMKKIFYAAYRNVTAPNSSEILKYFPRSSYQASADQRITLRIKGGEGGAKNDPRSLRKHMSSKLRGDSGKLRAISTLAS